MPSILWALLLVLPLAHAGELPKGFGGINVGDSWLDIQDRFGFENMADTSTDWDRYMQECGYRVVRMKTDKGELLITVNDYVVTDLVHVTPIEAGSDLMAVADLVIQSYGQPKAASMRDLFGTVSINNREVNYITLDYEDARAVQFNISGRDLWRYRIKVQFEHHRWHENRTQRCARQLHLAARKAPEEENRSTAPDTSGAKPEAPEE